MGEVYRAKDSRLDRDVAIKVLPPALAADFAWPDRAVAARDRFLASIETDACLKSRRADPCSNGLVAMIGLPPD